MPHTAFLSRDAQIPAVILAGGRSSRFGGGDKCLAMLGPQPVIGHVIETLRPQVAAIALNVNGDSAPYERFGLPLIPDDPPDYAGPLAGVLAGLDWAAAAGQPAIISVAGDTPIFPEDLVIGLRAAGITAHSALVTAYGRMPDGELNPHPVFGLWPVTLRRALRAALASGQNRVRAFTEAQGAAVAIFPEEGATFRNINTPEDLRAAALDLGA